MSSRNAAAWALKPLSRPLVVGAAADPSPPPSGHVVIRVCDVAVNPIDWILQDTDLFGLSYPAIFGTDVAGEVVAIADDVDDFNVGQRVIAICPGQRGTKSGPAQAGAFQKYVCVHYSRVAELPDLIPTSAGVVLPLGVTTAASGLFQSDFLALPRPVEQPKSLGRSIIVWGGSSSVGSSAIQLAVAAGADVIATASPKNFTYCKELGASAVFDYHDADVEDKIVQHLKGKVVAGAYHAVGADGAIQACARIVDRCKGKAIVATVGYVPKSGIPDPVRVKQISAPNLFNNDLGVYIWREYLPKALESGQIKPKPDPRVVGQQLRSVQAGLDAQRRGVSAEKIVISDIS